MSTYNIRFQARIRKFSLNCPKYIISAVVRIDPRDLGTNSKQP